MARKWLRSNRSNAAPQNFCFMDSETLPEKYPKPKGAELHRLRLGVANYCRLEKDEVKRDVWQRFTTCDQFWDMLETRLHPRIPLWLFTHNVGFDLTVMEFWRLLESRKFILTDPRSEDGGGAADVAKSRWGKGFMLLEDPPTVITGKLQGKGRLIIVDTLNYWLCSLAKLGKMVGTLKGKMPKFSASDERWFDYCEGDVQVIRDAVLGLIRWTKDNDYGRFRYTAPSQAMAAFRHRFYSFPIEFHDEPEVRALERSAYYGGRLECFYIGKVGRRDPTPSVSPAKPVSDRRRRAVGPIYELDVASLYPFVMRENLYPWRLVDSSFERGSPQGWDRQLSSDCVATVLLDTQDQFPRRSKDLGTIYPVGRYWTSLCGAELERALETDSIQDCSAWARYNTADLFTGFVDHFWEQRHKFELEGNTLYAGLCKLMMNSLYGKFGQMSAEWLDRTGIDPPETWGPWFSIARISKTLREFRLVGGNVQERMPPAEIENAFPAIAGFVTTYAREYMRMLRNVAGVENVYYMVTDALYVSQAGYERLNAAGFIADRELGKLTVKHKGETGEFVALHHLRIGRIRKRGSVKERAVRLSKRRYRETRFQGLRSIIAGRHPSSGEMSSESVESADEETFLPPLPGVLVYPVVKQFSCRYERGERLPSGWIAPLEFQEE